MDAQIARIHTAVSSDKPPDEIERLAALLGASVADALAARDPKNGSRCLHVAALHGHEGLVAWLLAERADVNAQNSRGHTALHMSVEHDFCDQSLLLLEAGADVELTNGQGHAALTGMNGKKDMAESSNDPMII